MFIVIATSVACWCFCSTHVASVLQMTHMIMVHGGVLKSHGADRLTLLASYIAALIHDFEHSGVNNDFLIKSQDELAVTYNLQSPLENHHLAASTRIFLQRRYSFLGVRSHPHAYLLQPA